MEVWHLEYSQTLPDVSLPSNNFILYPYPVINHNHEYYSFQ